jgi:ABC-type oligopeptide transport system ATPase subunit
VNRTERRKIGKVGTFEQPGKPMIQQEPLLRVENLHRYFSDGRHTIHAVNGVSFEVFPGEAVGLVGESGCGKSTTARCILMLDKPTHGKVIFRNQDLTILEGKNLRSCLNI